MYNSLSSLRPRHGSCWTHAATLFTVAAVVLTAAQAASTGRPAVVAGDMAAVSSDAHYAVAAAEPVVAESKKVAGKASLMDGYVRTGSTKGDKGYNEDDVYGDKDSDSYGFGTQVSFGSKAGDGGNGAYHESTAYDDNGRSNPKYSAWHFEEKDGKPTKRYVYDSLNDDGSKMSKNKKYDPLAVEAEASEYDSVEAYDDADDGGGGTHAGYEVDDAEPEYGNLYDSADVYNDADAYY
ncbi:unnamed protein product [Macrosiphum euphorbiae]|uniref:Uncharacterized protein n=1 Tax=Macrosiphum euphorbiae TaxID=13131 RepID=A0AAV0VNE7_9HEMI|nr:unnamed protein product [Macrosiphum euphorbiae]